MLLVVMSGCSDDDEIPASSNTTIPDIAGAWTDAYGGTLTISASHFSISGQDWGYAGSVVQVDNTKRHIIIRYTNSGTLASGPDILGRYNRIIWKDLVVNGSTARVEYQELYAAELTNSTGKFIAWPTLEAALDATNISSWYSAATNTHWQP